jgi:hypothetical protein
VRGIVEAGGAPRARGGGWWWLLRRSGGNVAVVEVLQELMQCWIREWPW